MCKSFQKCKTDFKTEPSVKLYSAIVRGDMRFKLLKLISMVSRGAHLDRTVESSRQKVQKLSDVAMITRLTRITRRK